MVSTLIEGERVAGESGTLSGVRGQMKQMWHTHPIWHTNIYIYIYACVYDCDHKSECREGEQAYRICTRVMIETTGMRGLTVAIHMVGWKAILTIKNTQGRATLKVR